MVSPQPFCWPFARPTGGLRTGDRLLEITGGTGEGFLRPKGNEGKGAASQVAWGVRPDGGFLARALLPWEAGEPQPGHQISLDLSRSTAGMCGREEMPFCMASVFSFRAA